ncbi:unnamed protein product [Pylaiella littoralis]
MFRATSSPASQGRHGDTILMIRVCFCVFSFSVFSDCRGYLYVAGSTPDSN